MTVLPAKASIRRPRLRRRWDRSRSSDALEHLREEFALWTALWTGFPLSNELDRTRTERSRR
jgi:hypothetical protein